MNKYHYVYRITNKELNKHYYGVRSSKVEPKLDLGIKYFSSSNDKDFMNEQKVNNSIFRYKVIKIFETREEAITLEIKLHSKFDVGRNESFYNRSKQTSKKFDTSGKGNYIDKNGIIISISKKEAKELGLKGCTTGYKAWNKGLKMPEEYNIMMKYIFKTNRRSYIGKGNPNYGKTTSDETKEKIRQGNLGKIMSKESKLKMSISRSGENHWNYGLNHSEETKEKMRKPKSEEAKQNIKEGIKLAGGRSGDKNSFYGKKHSIETIEKIKEAKLNMPIRICKHCGKEGRGSNMTRYHFDNCKRRN